MTNPAHIWSMTQKRTYLALVEIGTRHGAALGGAHRSLAPATKELQIGDGAVAVVAHGGAAGSAARAQLRAIGRPARLTSCGISAQAGAAARQDHFRNSLCSVLAERRK